ncbi:MAG TPA: hypothetical protein VJN64_00465 [Terriglobales bacterium]|nr:hypothetical protein [Terriglobales bacterium]
MKITLDKSLDSIPQMANMKVDQQANVLLAQPQIGNNLRFMNGCDLLDTFQFENHQIIYNHVDPVTRINANSLKNNRQFQLALNLKATFSQQMAEARSVSALQKPGTELRMDLHRCAYDAFGQRVDLNCLRAPL